MTRRGVAAAALSCVVVAGLCGLSGAAGASTATTTVTLSFVGDTILGNTPQLPARPWRYLRPVGPDLRAGADVVFANLEGTFTNATTGKCGATSGGNCFQFRNPPRFANAYANTGFGVLNLANNHSHDFGTAGLQSTETAIHDAGMRYTGLAGQITYLRRNGVRIAFVAFAPYWTSNNLLDLSTAMQLVRRAHNHAPVVVVYMHAGAEGATADHVTGQEEYYLGEDRGNPRRFAHRAIDNGASLVVASGPHVLRGMEFYKRHLIAYSLGDFANYHNFSSAGTLSRSVILHVTLTPTGGFQSGYLTSVTLTTGGRAYPGGDSISFIRRLSVDDFGTAAPRISSTGRIRRRT